MVVQEKKLVRKVIRAVAEDTRELVGVGSGRSTVLNIDNHFLQYIFISNPAVQRHLDWPIPSFSSTFERVLTLIAASFQKNSIKESIRKESQKINIENSQLFNTVATNF